MRVLRPRQGGRLNAAPQLSRRARKDQLRTYSLPQGAKGCILYGSSCPLQPAPTKATPM